MISTNDLRTGLTIDVDGEVYSVVEFQHVKPGKGAAFVRTKLKNMRTGRVVEQTFRAGEKVNRAHIERKEMQYLYREAESIVFMDNETYEQVSITEDQLGDNINYLQENMNIFVLIYNGELMGIDLPHSVELKVATTEPGTTGTPAWVINDLAVALAPIVMIALAEGPINLIPCSSQTFAKVGFSAKKP